MWGQVTSILSQGTATPISMSCFVTFMLGDLETIIPKTSIN